MFQINKKFFFVGAILGFAIIIIVSGSLKLAIILGVLVLFTMFFFKLIREEMKEQENRKKK